MKKLALICLLTVAPAGYAVADDIIVSPVADSETPTLVKASSTDHLFEGKPVLLAQAEPDAGIPAPPPTADDPPAPVVLPADKLHDPLTDPLATLDDIKQAKKQGWSFAILAVLVVLTATFARAAARWPSAFGWAAKHKYVIIVTAGVGSVAAAAYNALVLDGSWMAALLAGGGVLLTLISAKPAEAK